MTRNYRALGPDGFGVYALDSVTKALTPSAGEALGLLVPGFVDVHCHGAFGIDFMSASCEDISRLCDLLGKVGYAGFLPTTVTASCADVKRAISQLPDDPFVLGFHLEGPFLSPKYPGAQPPQAITDPPVGDSEWDEVLDDPRLRLITLAPERPGGLDLARRLSARGVRVSMGHTDATHAEALAGVEAGVRHATHTYNAMRPLHHREPGTVGLAITDDRVACELIYDRQHVARASAEVIFRCKGPDQVIAVSDSTMASGLPAGQMIRMWGLECIVGDRQVRLKDGTLAGSGITLLDAFRNIHDDFGVERAIRACSLNPRRLMEVPPSVGPWIVFDDKLEITELIA